MPKTQRIKLIELKAYEKGGTGTVHLVGTFPAPRTEGHSQCGQDLSEMVHMSKPLNQVPQYRLCRKCLQLLDIL